MKISYSFRAKQDLQDIYEYIAYTLLVPETAAKMTDTIMANAKTLGVMPERNPLYKRSHGIAKAFTLCLSKTI